MAAWCRWRGGYVGCCGNHGIHGRPMGADNRELADFHYFSLREQALKSFHHAGILANVSRSGWQAEVRFPNED